MITITIKTDNAAFQDGDRGRAEIARILRKIADDTEAHRMPDHVIDVNGNHCGNVIRTGEDRKL